MMLSIFSVEYDKMANDHGMFLRAPGEIVVARYSQDHFWYRARVVDVTEEKIKVCETLV